MTAPRDLRLRLPRDVRLQPSREFATTRAVGRRLVRGCLIANWRLLPEGSRTQLGVVTSRRVGGAVVRNRARRLLREAFRLTQHSLTQPAVIVLVARPSIAGRSFAEVQRDYLGALRNAGLLGARS